MYVYRAIRMKNYGYFIINKYIGRIYAGHLRSNTNEGFGYTICILILLYEILNIGQIIIVIKVNKNSNVERTHIESMYNMKGIYTARQV